MSLRRVGTGLSAVLLCLALACAATGAEKPAIGPVPQIDPADIAAGFCKGPKGQIPMREVLYLENRTIDWTFPRGKRRVWIDRDHLYTSNPAKPSEGFTYVGVNYLLTGNPDIVLKLAVYDGQLLVYWRETFQHREFRQGLILVTDEGSGPALCEGEAGEWLSH